MIAVTGATGQLGQLVIQSLLNKVAASEIVAIVRNEEKAGGLKALGVNVKVADYSQPEHLKQALAGVDKLLLISGSEVGQRVAQHANVIQAAKQANLSLFAYTSLLHADKSPLILAQEHKETEALINAAGLPAVILRNAWYTENYTQGASSAVEFGAVAGCAQNGILNTASRADYAEAAAVVLTSNQNQVGQVYELAGDQGFTLTDFANELSKQSGKPVSYNNLSEQEFTEFLVSVGLPEGFAAILADSEKGAAAGWLADNSKTLSRLIGRSTIPLAKSIEQVL